MPSDSPRLAIVVRGGWEGHVPVQATELFIPHLRANGFEVRVFDSPAPYADAGLMAAVDLVVQCVTMGTISDEEVAGLRSAISAGTGMAGWHGGMIDSYRASSDYLQLMGAQFTSHPGKDPAIVPADEPGRNFVPHTVRMLPAAAAHPITQGIGDFDLVTEQYWLLHDDYLDVLATATQQVRPWDEWKREVTSPVIWTRQWGAGRLFVATPGHDTQILAHAAVRTVIERGLLWASR
jgi:type 1 glutamine amidotransferase